jgi:hypothetical protein
MTSFQLQWPQERGDLLQQEASRQAERKQREHPARASVRRLRRTIATAGHRHFARLTDAKITSTLTPAAAGLRMPGYGHRVKRLRLMTRANH